MAVFLFLVCLQLLCIPTVITDREEDPEYVTDAPGVATKNVTAHYCPFPCTVGNETLCYPPPCPPPDCVDPARLQPTDCCEYCPNGPDCRAPDGSIVRYQHWKIVKGRNCTCEDPISRKTVCN